MVRVCCAPLPGSAFGQKPGSFHLRVTILPPEDAIATMMADFVTFHKTFMDQYRGDPVRL